MQPAVCLCAICIDYIQVHLTLLFSASDGVAVFVVVAARERREIGEYAQLVLQGSDGGQKAVYLVVCGKVGLGEDIHVCFVGKGDIEEFFC